MNIPKIIVRYLPQFHQVPENDEWWGEGFTEWTAVRKGEALFGGHQQPRKPLNENYYDLLEKKTMQWQAQLGKKYGIGGFAFYHYWFKDGRRILEKPAENLLRWNDVDMPFCFSWANETWARTWSNLVIKNTWADVFEKDKKGRIKDKGILLDQRYGDKDAWLEHIHYLLPFFKDNRYIKYNNKPVFMIYQPADICCLSDMLECWNEVLYKNGFDGIYLIGETNKEYIPHLLDCDAMVIRFPDYSMQKMNPKILENGLKLYDYDTYWDILFQKNWGTLERPSYLCIAVDFDSTPRRGTAGILLDGVSSTKFSVNFLRALRMAQSLGHAYFFINAWNEWGEGMYLEPDDKHGYGYLEAIKDGIDEINKKSISVYDIRENNIYERVNKRAFIYERGVKALSRWMTLREEGKSISSFLHKNNYRKVAIYGLGYMGRHLVSELIKDNDIKISYIIDKAVDAVTVECPTYQLSNKLPSVDIIIVTLTGQYDEIRQDIRKFVLYPTISLEHIIFES